jgi:hypothetical protein
VFSALAVAGTVANFLYTQWATNRRDIAKWRREELQKLISNLLQLSQSRQSDLNEAYEAFESHFHNPLPGRERSTGQNVWQMELIVEQIRLLDDELAASAEAVWKAHRDAEWEYAAAGDADPMSELELLSAPGLNVLHHKLIDDFRRVVKLPKQRGKSPVSIEGAAPDAVT